MISGTAVDKVAFVWTRVVPPPGRSSAAVERATWLTPYDAATVAGDALHAGRGASLELTVSSNLDEATVGQLRREFAWLGGRGVQVSVRRQGHANRAA
jgi:hypothetical protein